jgi:hypothetical protein
LASIVDEDSIGLGGSKEVNEVRRLVVRKERGQNSGVGRGVESGRGAIHQMD